jgi:DNA-binding transcriptional regulator YiaG
MMRTQIITEHVAGTVFSAEIPVEQTAEGAAFSGWEVRRFELGIARALAERGVATGESFRFLRKTLGLAAKTLAELLDVNAETVSRWETGKTSIPRAAFAVLGAMVADARRNEHTTRQHLEALAHPAPAAAEIRIDLSGPIRAIDRMFAHHAQILVHAALQLYGTGLQSGVLDEHLDEHLIEAEPVTISLPPALKEVLAATREVLAATPSSAAAERSGAELPK